MESVARCSALFVLMFKGCSVKQPPIGHVLTRFEPIGATLLTPPP